LGKELVLTIRSDDKVHFDLAGYRFLQWSTPLDLQTALQQRFAGVASAKKIAQLENEIGLREQGEKSTDSSLRGMFSQTRTAGEADAS
jgi:hypothetical protein